MEGGREIVREGGRKKRDGEEGCKECEVEGKGRGREEKKRRGDGRVKGR